MKEMPVHEISRRTFGGVGLAALLASQSNAAGLKPAAGQFGQINKLTSKPGKVAALRAELKTVTGLLAASAPDALTYEVLSHDTEPNTLWTIELWPSADAHATAVAAPSVQASIGRCRALIDRFENIATFNTAAPVAGRG